MTTETPNSPGNALPEQENQQTNNAQNPARHADSSPSDEQMARAEAKPPLYRVFRGALYVTYMAVVVWFCLSITIGVYRAFLR